MNILQGILHNTPLLAALAAWAIAQGTKILLTLLLERQLDLTRIVGTGGMPSSHSALTMALSFSIGKYWGFDSPYFAIALIFSFVVMYDAAGKQAEIINKLILHHQMPDMKKLKELLGHTPLEVAVGAILGIGIGLWL